MTRITDPCPSCGQPSHRINYGPSRQPDSSLAHMAAAFMVLLTWGVALYLLAALVAVA